MNEIPASADITYTGNVVTDIIVLWGLLFVIVIGFLWFMGGGLDGLKLKERLSTSLLFQRFQDIAPLFF